MENKMNIESNRAGIVIKTPTGYNSFVPNPLPPNPPIAFDDEIQSLLSEAGLKLGRLDGITQILPNPGLFVAMYVKKEAILSSQIEGTQASLVDVLEAPSYNEKEYSSDGVKEVINYVNAMYHGLDRLSSLPLSLRLIKEIHEILLNGVRGADKSPGEFRRSQNWIGPAGCNLSTATYVPPTVEDMKAAMYDLEKYIYDESYIPALIKIALIHAQFETIHPFLDGNGRMGRLLITFWLCQQKILSQPLLYLSYYFKLNRDEYYNTLMDVRLKGDWEKWIKFFLRGVSITADESTRTAKEILSLRSKYDDMLENYCKERKSSFNYQPLLNLIFDYPVLNRKKVEKELGVSGPKAGRLIKTFCDLGILEDTDKNRERYKKFIFADYIRVLQRGVDELIH